MPGNEALETKALLDEEMHLPCALAVRAERVTALRACSQALPTRSFFDVGRLGDRRLAEGHRAVYHCRIYNRWSPSRESKRTQLTFLHQTLLS